MFLEVEEPPGHRLDPLLIRVLVEHEPLVGEGNAPRAGRQLGGGIIAGNSLILLLAWRADSLTADLLVSSVITSVIMAAVGVLACAAPARRALRVQPTEALRQG